MMNLAHESVPPQRSAALRSGRCGLMPTLLSSTDCTAKLTGTTSTELLTIATWDDVTVCLRTVRDPMGEAGSAEPRKRPLDHVREHGGNMLAFVNSHGGSSPQQPT